MSTRSVKKIFHAKPVLEGAGVHLKRAFIYHELPQFDPFLPMDDFRNDEPEVENRTLVLYHDGNMVRLRAGGASLRLLFISGKPFREHISWGGPIAMNTREELDLAFSEFRIGRFIK